MASILLCLSLLGFPIDPTVHDLPDGVVKVSTQVVVELDKTHVRYDVGFNPTTLDQLLKELAPETKADATAKDKMEAFRNAFKVQLVKSLTVQANDHDVKSEKISFDANEITKHVQARFFITYEIPIKEETTIAVSDLNFKNQTRVCSSGFKSTGTIAVKESSTKAIPIRSKPTEKQPEDAGPFVISGTVVKLSVSIDGKETSSSMAPFFVLLIALGGAGAVGFMLVPSDGGDDHHDDHH